MPDLDLDIYASATLKALLADETAALAHELARCAGDHGLHIAAAPGVPLPPMPLLGHWTQMRVRGATLAGDVQASAAEPLPFLDDAFGVVLLRHALEVAAVPAELLREAARVLEPGGMLAITGVHPLSCWAPWVLWRSRVPRPSLSLPLWWLRRLAEADFEAVAVRRLSSLMPTAVDGGSTYGSSTHGAGSPLGGGYMIVARKRRLAMTPLRVKTAPITAPLRGTLASGARRSTR
jgi:SAM-dependent methyltransferase